MPARADFRIVVSVTLTSAMSSNDYGVLVAMLIDTKTVASFRIDRHRVEVDMLVPTEDVSIRTVQDAAKKIRDEVEAFVEVICANRGVNR